MVDSLSLGTAELYEKFGLKAPPITNDMKLVRIENAGKYSTDDLISFLNHEITAEQLRARKLPPKDDS